MNGPRLLVNIHRVGQRPVVWVAEQPLQPQASQHERLLREVHAAEEGLLMSALSESHVERYTEHNTKPDPLRHLVSCRTDGCTYTDTHRNP